MRYKPVRFHVDYIIAGNFAADDQRYQRGNSRRCRAPSPRAFWRPFHQMAIPPDGLRTASDKAQDYAEKPRYLFIFDGAAAVSHDLRFLPLTDEPLNLCRGKSARPRAGPGTYPVILANPDFARSREQPVVQPFMIVMKRR